MNIRGLLGAFQQQPDQLQSLLGEYYDPRTAKMKWLGGTLQGLGMGLASGQPGAWATGLAQGGGQALDDYRKDAQQGYMLAQAKQDQDWQAKERARKESEWAKDDANTAQMNALIGKLPENERVYAQISPETWVKSKLNPSGEGGGYYGVPLPYVQADGTVGYGLPSKAGGFAPLNAPQGGKFLSPFEVNNQKAAGTAVGTQQGGAAAALPSALVDFNATSDKVDALLENPNLPDAIGYGSAIGDMFTSNQVLDIRKKINELKGGSFMSAYSALKGSGQITEIESAQAKQAIADMDTAMKMSDPEMFKDALREFKSSVGRGIQKLQAQAGQYAPSGAAPQPQTSGFNLGDQFENEADIPEGATVVDDNGVAYKKINGKLVKRQ